MNLSAWLQYIEALHPREMELGLDRVSAVARRLDLDLGGARVISVAGTNGKGSSVALLEGLLLAQDIRVGAYTSPHLLRFNERIRIVGDEVEDQPLCEAFSRIESARDQIRLTYFEFGTLAALLLFQQAQLDVVILEVGLGGRLDAVNIVDSDVALITNIDLDHMAWLGTDREAIAREKAGIMRSGRPVVCADRDPPASLFNEATIKAAPMFLIGREFESHADGDCYWAWSGKGPESLPITLQQLKVPQLHSDLAAAALQVLALLGLLQYESVIREAIGEIGLAGRFDRRADRIRSRQIVLDVAHNPAAARQLATRLTALKGSLTADARIFLVLAMMADKDVIAFAQALASVVDIWYIAQVDQQRCMAAALLADKVAESVNTAEPAAFDSVVDAYQAACSDAAPEDIIVVTGSFYTVSEVLGVLEK